MGAPFLAAPAVLRTRVDEAVNFGKMVLADQLTDDLARRFVQRVAGVAHRNSSFGFPTVCSVVSQWALGCVFTVDLDVVGDDLGSPPIRFL
jgi:hypothetical protein